MPDGPNVSSGTFDGQGAPAPLVTPPGHVLDRDPYPTRQRRSRTVRVVLWVVVALLVVAASVAGSVFAMTESLGNNIQRVPQVFSPLDPVARPVPTDQLSFLLIGRDSGASPTPPDAYLLATAGQSRTTSSVVAIPSGVRVAMAGHGEQRLDAAQALGGPALQVSAVEALTSVHVDHHVILDFERIAATVDELGGIDVGVAQATASGSTTFARGINHLSGARVLDYLRQPGLVGGDQTRVQRQQAVMRGLLHRAMRTVPGGPIGFYNLIDAASGAVSLDDTLTNNALRGLGIELRNMRPGQSVFLTAPTGAPAADGSVALDPARAGQLWQAVRSGSVGSYGQQNPADVLGAVSP